MKKNLYIMGIIFLIICFITCGFNLWEFIFAIFYTFNYMIGTVYTIINGNNYYFIQLPYFSAFIGILMVFIGYLLKNDRNNPMNETIRLILRNCAIILLTITIIPIILFPFVGSCLLKVSLSALLVFNIWYIFAILLLIKTRKKKKDNKLINNKQINIEEKKIDDIFPSS